MIDFILTPPIAFIVYLILIGVLSGVSWKLAAQGQPSEQKSSTYSSGEAPPTKVAAPGYQPFFVIALFFAILHLGVLILGSIGISTVSVIYLAGLILTLIVLILG
jgi:NADH:ubiquinone oxidoreductase subunit 3 (subunit A)